LNTHLHARRARLYGSTGSRAALSGVGQQLRAERERCAAAAMSHPAEIADADECRRQHVQQDSSQELVDWQHHQTLLVVVSRIAPAKSDYAIGKSDESMVRLRVCPASCTERSPG